MSLETISRNAPKGAPWGVSKNPKEDIVAVNAHSTGSYDNFKGLAAAPVAAGAGTFGVTGAIGATGALGAIGAALAARFASCSKNIGNVLQDAPRSISKNAPKMLHLV